MRGSVTGAETVGAAVDVLDDRECDGTEVETVVAGRRLWFWPDEFELLAAETAVEVGSGKTTEEDRAWRRAKL